MNGIRSEDLGQLAWVMSLNAHAITMDTAAPYNTFKLTAVPRTIDGSVLSGASGVTFTSLDSSVRVSDSGLLTARKVGTNVKVIATTVYGGVRIADTATINVTAVSNPPSFRTLHFQVPAGDTPTLPPPNGLANQLYYASKKTLEVGARDAAGVQIPNSIVALSLSNSSQVTFSFSPAVKVLRTTTMGSKIDVVAQSLSLPRVPVTVYASATVYGVTMQDSLQLLLSNPLFFIYTVTKAASSSTTSTTTPSYTLLPYRTDTIGVGGWVWWINHTASADSLDIVFDNPADVSADPVLNSGSGDIGPFPGDPDPAQAPDFTQFLRSRHFLQAGEFPWHSSRTGLSGTIVVQ
jgi:hypothetical protein